MDAFLNYIVQDIDIEEDSNFKKYNIGHTKERYKKMQNFSEGFILIFIPSRGKYAYMDSRSYVIIPKQYAEYGFFREGRAKVKDYNGKWGYINPKMEEVIATKYDEIGFFKDGLAKVKNYGRSQTIDKNGTCIFDCY